MLVFSAGQDGQVGLQCHGGRVGGLTNSTLCRARFALCTLSLFCIPCLSIASAVCISISICSTCRRNGQRHFASNCVSKRTISSASSSSRSTRRKSALRSSAQVKRGSLAVARPKGGPGVGIERTSAQCDRLSAQFVRHALQNGRQVRLVLGEGARVHLCAVGSELPTCVDCG